MKTNNAYLFILCMMLVLSCGMMVGCGSSSSADKTYTGDTVSVEIYKMSDSSSFVKSSGERCNVIVEASVAIPVKYGKNDDDVKTLNDLINRYVLDCGDSLTIKDGVAHMLNGTLHQYDFSDAPDDNEIIEGDEPTDNAVQTFTTSINIYVIYNKFNVLTLCKVEMLKKDDQVSSISHKYYNFDMKNHCFIDLNKVFNEDALSMVNNELRNELKRSNKVSNDDQLNELGYYNIDNLNVTNNFYFEDKGITWSYLPNELAVEALGEPKVTMPYEVLEPYINEKSVIKYIQY
ncbi:MAG: DUF3298 domain-containing protein [Bacteroidales bacterium]|uniref:RsiV family protein n=1 Tax=Sodaliphilus sp. TaxID=2815818 RepID=UPI001B63D24A|nr:DUF3298 domain-containing protein [Candidatus Sodaliphilus limicaballi]